MVVKWIPKYCSLEVKVKIAVLPTFHNIREKLEKNSGKKTFFYAKPDYDENELICLCNCKNK